MDTIAQISNDVDALISIEALYFHFPFCFHKCHYCDFYSIVGNPELQAFFCDRLIDEVVHSSRYVSSPISSIFIGGGTPTLLGVDLWQKIINAIHDTFEFDSDNLEWTVEANPETVSLPLLKILCDGGVNRISIGAQSFDSKLLKVLERWHNPESVNRAVATVLESGITDINLDMIFGIPGQGVRQWVHDLELAIGLGPTHLSCYSLTYEANTPLYSKKSAGLIQPVAEDIEIEMFQCTRKILCESGYEPYEISNFSQPGKRCRHNLNYWHNGNWLAFGPGACGHINGQRWKNVADVGLYLQSTGLSPIVEYEKLSLVTQIAERIMLGLRLDEGISYDKLREDLDKSEIRSDFITEVEKQIEWGNLKINNNNLSLTDSGILLADKIIVDLMGVVDP